MKKLAFIALAACVSFVSCSDDDNAPVNDVALEGTWKLTAFDLNESFDLNNDGTSSASLISESGCYDNSIIVFGNNNSAMFTIQELDIMLNAVVGNVNEMEFEVDCIAGTPEMATYTATGNTVEIDFPGTEDDDMPLVMTKSGNTLSVSIPGVTAVPVEGTNGEVTYDFVGGTMVFTKQ